MDIGCLQLEVRLSSWHRAPTLQELYVDAAREGTCGVDLTFERQVRVFIVCRIPKLLYFKETVRAN